MPPFLDDDGACTSGSAVVSRVDVTDDPDPVAKAGASLSTGEAASQPAIFNSAEDVVEDPTMSFQLPFCKFQKIYESIDQYPQVSEAASRALRAASGVEMCGVLRAVLCRVPPHPGLVPCAVPS